MTKGELIAFEKRVAKLWEKGKLRVPIHLSGGNEEQLIKLFKSIAKDDYVFSTWRNHYHYLLHTGKKKELLEQIKNSSLGSMHTVDVENNFYTSGIVGGHAAIAVGVALALKKKGSNKQVWCFVGDGALDSGWVHEAMRYARGWDLPITFVVEDNNRSVCTSMKERWGKDFMAIFGIYSTQKVYYYTYKPTYPHVGSGVYVSF